MLDNYLEKLYDTMDDKVEGTFLILQLARNHENLEALVSNGSVAISMSLF
jgi:hypothetical protein